jgi:hypothetical protein
VTETQTLRVSTVTYTYPSHIKGMPYEVRREVVTDYDDYKGDSRAWDDLPKDDRDVWSDWLDRMHAQDCRLVEAHLTPDEEAVYGEIVGCAEWEDLPFAVERALDEIIAARN